MRIRQTVHIEVQLLRSSASQAFEAKLQTQMAEAFSGRSLLLCRPYQETSSCRVLVGEAIEGGRVLSDGFVIVDGAETELQFHFYRAAAIPMGWFPSAESAEPGPEGSKYRISAFPRDGFSVWESLVYEGQRQYDILYELLVMHRLTGQNANTVVLNCNRLVLLTGPPGTGKTTLCHAIAHKVAVRTGCRVFLAEINCQTVLSKWFSESGKLIQGLFDELTMIVNRPESTDILMVLFDEIESLLINRANLIRSSEPSDSLRVFIPARAAPLMQSRPSTPSSPSWTGSRTRGMSLSWPRPTLPRPSTRPFSPGSMCTLRRAGRAYRRSIGSWPRWSRSWSGSSCLSPYRISCRPCR